MKLTCHQDHQTTYSMLYIYIHLYKHIYIYSTVDIYIYTLILISRAAKAGTVVCIADGSTKCTTDGARLQQLFLDEQQWISAVLVCSSWGH